MRFGDFDLVDKKYETKIEHRYKNWEIKEIKSVICLCIGFRTIYEGEIEGGEGYEDIRIFIPKKSIKVALVVSSPRKKPFYVPIE